MSDQLTVKKLNEKLPRFPDNAIVRTVIHTNRRGEPKYTDLQIQDVDGRFVSVWTWTGFDTKDTIRRIDDSGVF